MLGAVLAVAIAVLYLWPIDGNPPGFYRDEAAIALNATTIAQSGRDEFGGRLPLFFRSFGDYKSPGFVYVVAAVFAVASPAEGLARAVAAAFVLGAVFGLAWLAWRLTREPAVAVATGLLAASCPWLFDVSRLAFEVTTLPLAFVLVLLTVERASRREAWGPREAVPIGLALSAVAYAYVAGRLLAALLALTTLVFATRRRLAGLALVFGVFAATTVVPFLVFDQLHPGALSAEPARCRS
jgi:4-amino-4-deoxy-L-arabinose transferase-like glycosyltransferase